MQQWHVHGGNNGPASESHQYAQEAKLSTTGATAGVDPSVGDIAYFAPWSNLAIYYQDFGYSTGLVRLGHIDGGIEMLPQIRAKHPRIEVEVTIEARFVDIVAEGYDAGVRLSEAIERDMVQVRLTDPFRFVIVGSPSYFERYGIPERPEDLLRHECITFRSQTTGALYAWEFERRRRTWRVPVRGGVVTSDARLNASMAEQGLGLSYAFEPMEMEQVRTGRLQRVLEAYSPTVPGFFLYFPSRAQRSARLRLFIETAKALKGGVKPSPADASGSSA